MPDGMTARLDHDHVFLGEGHARSEKRTWAVIWLCGAMMVAEIVGGLMFGSIALVADGLHMTTHAGALLLAALAYRYARTHAADPRFSFGTGKLGDLAGFTSAVALAMISLLIAYEAIGRLIAPQPIRFDEAIPIAVLGLAVNVASVWLLGGGHSHGHAHGHDHGHAHDDEKPIDTPDGRMVLSVFEDGVPPRFRLHAPHGLPQSASVRTIRPDGSAQTFTLRDRGGYLESAEAIPEPHAFSAIVELVGGSYAVAFEEHDHQAAHGRDNNMRAAVVHVMADAAVSVCVIAGLTLGKVFGWVWMDALAGLLGAVVIMSWAYTLVRDTGAILLDMNPDPRLADRIRGAVETGGDRLADLHLWRLGPGHLGAILCVVTASGRGAGEYRARLADLPSLSHVTVEVLGPTP